MADTQDSRRTRRSGFRSGAQGNIRPGGSRPSGSGPGRQTSGSTRPGTLASPSPTAGPVRGGGASDAPKDHVAALADKTAAGAGATPGAGAGSGSAGSPSTSSGQSAGAQSPTSGLHGGQAAGAPASTHGIHPGDSAGSAGSSSGKAGGKQGSDSPSGKSAGGNQGGGSRGLAGIGGLLSRNRKKFGLVGIMLALVGLVSAFILGLAPFKLVHLFEILDQYFGARADHTTSLRVGKIWQAVADKNGNLHYARNTGHPLKDHIYNVNTKRLVNDMRAKGLNLNLDPKTGHITMNGKAIDGDLADRRSTVRSALKDAYPEDGYLRRAVRAHRTFLAFGISRRFFENTREKINDWEREMKQKIRNRLFGDEADKMSASAAKESKNSTETNKALDDLNNELGAQAEAERQKALADPTSVIEEPKTELSDAQLAADGATSSVKSALNITAVLTQVCNIRNLMEEVVLAAKVLRERALAREAGIYLVAAAQFMSGDGISLGELDALMNTTTGFDQSPAYDRVTGSNTSASYGNSAAQYSLDLTQQGGGAAFFVHLTNALMSIPGAVCSVATNIFFQIGSTILTIAADFFTGGGISITGIAIGTASGFAIGATEEILKPMAINMLAGMTVTGDESGSKRFIAVAGGAAVIYNDFFRRNGGFGAVTNKQKQALLQEDQIIAKEKAQDNARLSIVNRVFNLNNPNSAMARFAFAMPNDFSGLSTSMLHMFSYLNPMVFERAMISPNGVLMRFASPANADYPPFDDPLGVTQQYMPDDMFNDQAISDPVANEAYILDNPTVKTQWLSYRDKCFNSTDVDPNDAGNSNTVGMCNDETNELYRRFHEYQLDLGLAGGVDFTTGSVSDLPDDDSAQ